MIKPFDLGSYLFLYFKKLTIINQVVVSTIFYVHPKPWGNGFNLTCAYFHIVNHKPYFSKTLSHPIRVGASLLGSRKLISNIRPIKSGLPLVFHGKLLEDFSLRIQVCPNRKGLGPLHSYSIRMGLEPSILF